MYFITYLTFFSECWCNGLLTCVSFTYISKIYTLTPRALQTWQHIYASIIMKGFKLQNLFPTWCPADAALIVPRTSCS